MDLLPALKGVLYSIAPWFPWWQLRTAAEDFLNLPVLLVYGLLIFLERRKSAAVLLTGLGFMTLNLLIFYFLCVPLIDRLRLLFSLLPGFQLRLITALPLLWQVVIGLLIEDFLEYVCHRYLHRNSWLWPFHEVHHADERLGQGSAFIGHSLIPLLGYAIRAIPLAVLGGAPAAIVNMRLASICMGLYQHSNVSLPLGPLRFLIVTPQFHRVHHSIDPRHHNCNYGVFFTLWDVLFGTANWKTSGETLQLGTQRLALYGDGLTARNFFRTWMRMQLHPFQRLRRYYARRPIHARGGTGGELRSYAAGD